MPRPKRDVRASGVARSLGAGPRHLILCVDCERRLPRDAIAFIARKPVSEGKHKGKSFALCGRCYEEFLFRVNKETRGLRDQLHEKENEST